MRSVSTADGQQVSFSNVAFSSSHESQMEQWRYDGRQGKNRRAVNILTTKHMCYKRALCVPRSKHSPLWL